MMTHQSGARLEHQLFEYKERDQTDDATYTFENVTLSVQVGSYSKGTKFALAIMDYELALLSLYKEEGDDTASLVAKLSISLEDTNEALSS